MAPKKRNAKAKRRGGQQANDVTTALETDTSAREAVDYNDRHEQKHINRLTKKKKTRRGQKTKLDDAALKNILGDNNGVVAEKIADMCDNALDPMPNGAENQSRPDSNDVTTEKGAYGDPDVVAENVTRTPWIIDVTCGENSALLFMKGLSTGSKGACVLFEQNWLTANEFQYVSGRESAKDWKRSIKHHGKSLKILAARGLMCLKQRRCKCFTCEGRDREDDSVGSPSLSADPGESQESGSRGSADHGRDEGDDKSLMSPEDPDEKLRESTTEAETESEENEHTMSDDTEVESQTGEEHDNSPTSTSNTEVDESDDPEDTYNDDIPDTTVLNAVTGYLVDDRRTHNLTRNDDGDHHENACNLQCISGETQNANTDGVISETDGSLSDLPSHKNILLSIEQSSLDSDGNKTEDYDAEESSVAIPASVKDTYTDDIPTFSSMTALEKRVLPLASAMEKQERSGMAPTHTEQDPDLTLQAEVSAFTNEPTIESPYGSSSVASPPSPSTEQSSSSLTQTGDTKELIGAATWTFTQKKRQKRGRHARWSRKRRKSQATGQTIPEKRLKVVDDFIPSPIDMNMNEELSPKSMDERPIELDEDKLIDLSEPTQTNNDESCALDDESCTIAAVSDIYEDSKRDIEDDINTVLDVKIVHSDVCDKAELLDNSKIVVGKTSAAIVETGTGVAKNEHDPVSVDPTLLKPATTTTVDIQGIIDSLEKADDLERNVVEMNDKSLESIRPLSADSRTDMVETNNTKSTSMDTNHFTAPDEPMETHSAQNKHKYNIINDSVCTKELNEDKDNIRDNSVPVAENDMASTSNIQHSDTCDTTDDNELKTAEAAAVNGNSSPVSNSSLSLQKQDTDAHPNDGLCDNKVSSVTAHDSDKSLSDVKTINITPSSTECSSSSSTATETIPNKRKKKGSKLMSIIDCLRTTSSTPCAPNEAKPEISENCKTTSDSQAHKSRKDSMPKQYCQLAKQYQSWDCDEDEEPKDNIQQDGDEQHAKNREALLKKVEKSSTFRCSGDEKTTDRAPVIGNTVDPKPVKKTSESTAINLKEYQTQPPMVNPLLPFGMNIPPALFASMMQSGVPIEWQLALMNRQLGPNELALLTSAMNHQSGFLSGKSQSKHIVQPSVSHMSSSSSSSAGGLAKSGMSSTYHRGSSTSHISPPSASASRHGSSLQTSLTNGRASHPYQVHQRGSSSSSSHGNSSRVTSGGNSSSRSSHNRVHPAFGGGGSNQSSSEHRSYREALSQRAMATMHRSGSDRKADTSLSWEDLRGSSAQAQAPSSVNLRVPGPLDLTSRYVAGGSSQHRHSAQLGVQSNSSARQHSVTGQPLDLSFRK